jgi:hypothetical protein
MIQAESMLARTDEALNCHFSQFMKVVQLSFDQITSLTQSCSKTDLALLANVYG